MFAIGYIPDQMYATKFEIYCWVSQLCGTHVKVLKHRNVTLVLWSASVKALCVDK